MDDPGFSLKYKKYKYKVKLWEKNFKEKKGRIPSKGEKAHDIRDASLDIRYAYKMYYKLKTSLLEETLSDVLFDEDIDGFDVSNLSQSDANFSSSEFSLPSQFADLENEELKTLGVKKLIEFEAEESNELNEKAWGEHLNVKKDKDEKETEKISPPKHLAVKVVLKPEMFETKSFVKRNPRKSLSRKSSSFLKDTKNSYGYVNKEKLPDLETILASKSQDRDKSFGLSTVSTTKCSMALDDGWLKRCHSMNSISMDQFESNIGSTSSVSQIYEPQRNIVTGIVATNLTGSISSIGLSSLNLNIEKTQSVVTLSDKLYDGISDGIVENSEDESIQRSVRHVRKKRKIVIDMFNESENCSPPSSTNNSFNNDENLIEKQQLVENVSNLQDLGSSRIKNSSKNLKKQEIENKNVKPTSSKYLTRQSERKAVCYKNNESCDDEDPFKCQNDSDKDPSFEIDNKNLSPEKTEVKRAKKDKVKKFVKEKILKKQNKSKLEVKTPKRSSTRSRKDKSSPQLSYEDDEKPIYMPDIDRIDNIPRVNALELQNTTEIVEKFLRGEDTAQISGTSYDFNEPNQNKPKIETKISSGKLNENFVRLNIKKKVFVRGKKVFNFSRYKKSEWRKKKAAALSGPEMDMRGCDGGVLVCFNCNGVGHMAQKCPVKGDALLANVDDDNTEESPFQTLEEVTSMLIPREQQGDKFVGHEIPKDILEQSGILELTKIADNYQVESIYRSNVDGSVIDAPQEVFDVLKMFGHSSFRHGQENAIMRILSGKSTLVTLSTGSGKSLCYQLPAYIYSRQKKCCTLVISPLVSLMEDQVYGVPKFLNAQCLHTNQTPRVKEKIMAQIKEGLLDVLLISPEAVISSENMHGFGSVFKELPPIAFACIDEAHCVSQWSHNFRPSYLMICQVLREKLKIKTILGLTATATQQTRESIIKHLGIPDGKNGIISDIPLPDNLFLSASRDDHRDRALLELLKSKRFENCNSIIVYCTRRDECERVAGFLRSTLQSARGIDSNVSKKRARVNWDAESYHAGMAASRRKTIQNAFMSGNLRIVVATVAFGMGINKSDIRAVIHYNMPKNIESYVQEIGRAGRDGKPAQCHIFLDSRGTDQNELRRHIFTNSIDRHVIRKLLQKIFVPCACVKNLEKTGKRCQGHEVAFSIEDTVNALDIPQENISTLLCYLELSTPKYITVLRKAYTVCKLMSYSGVKSIRQAAQTCAPLAMAIAWDLKKGIEHDKSTVVEFPVVDIASSIGWDSGLVKHMLKNLEWTNENGYPKRSSISVQFFNLGFRIRAPGDLTDDELDNTLDMLFRRVQSQERTELVQLQYLVNAVKTITLPSYQQAFEVEKIEDSSNTIKTVIREYFNGKLDLDIALDKPVDNTPDDVILNDVYTMISRYPDNTFTGRTLARIFHGCQSPNFPAVMWSRCKYWRSHLNVDFNRIVTLANQAIVKMRS